MGFVYGICTHNPTNSDAIAVYHSFPLKRRDNLVWIYLPISRNDTILALGLRELNKGGQCIMV